MSMTLQRAVEIVSQYGRIMKGAQEGQYFQATSKLPCSAARVKFAICRVLMDRIRLGQLDMETMESLVVAYSHLAFFVDEEAAADLNALTTNRGQGPENQEALGDMLKVMNSRKHQLSREIQLFIREELKERLAQDS
jgi:hypothetical protein